MQGWAGRQSSMLWCGVQRKRASRAGVQQKASAGRQAGELAAQQGGWVAAAGSAQCIQR